MYDAAVESCPADGEVQRLKFCGLSISASNYFNWIFSG